MRSQLIATRDGEWEDAIERARERLKEYPGDILSHFTLAQAYEATRLPEQAIVYAEKCVVALPESFEALSLAARCAMQVERYEDAYRYAEKALLDRRNPNLPRTIRMLFKVLSCIPGLKGLRTANEASLDAYTKQTQWLYEYVAWYERQSSDGGGYTAQ